MAVISQNSLEKMTLEPAKVNGASVRPKTLQRRADLLGVVYESISEHGIDGVSMRQIAEAAKISTGTINYHFGNKRNLIIAALEAAYELPEDWENYSGSPLAQLRRLVMGYIFRTPRDRFWRFWVNYLAYSTRDEEMRQHQEERFNRQGKFWRKLISDAVGQGELRKDINVDETARHLLLMAHGLIVAQLHAPTAEMREMAHLQFDHFFQGILPPVRKTAD